MILRAAESPATFGFGAAMAQLPISPPRLRPARAHPWGPLGLTASRVQHTDMRQLATAVSALQQAEESGQQWRRREMTMMSLWIIAMSGQAGVQNVDCD